MPPVRKPVGTMTVRNVEYPVLFEYRPSGREASGGSAEFLIESVPGSDFAVSAKDWDSLYNKMMLATKRAKVTIAIPVVSLSHRGGARNASQPYLRSGVITGKHGNQNLLIKWEDRDRVEQVQTWNAKQDFLREMSAERQSAYLDIVRRFEAIEQERERFESAYKIDDLDGEIEAEIERVASEDVRS